MGLKLHGNPPNLTSTSTQVRTTLTRHYQLLGRLRMRLLCRRFTSLPITTLGCLGMPVYKISLLVLDPDLVLAIQLLYSLSTMAQTAMETTQCRIGILTALYLMAPALMASLWLCRTRTLCRSIPCCPCLILRWPSTLHSTLQYPANGDLMAIAVLRRSPHSLGLTRFQFLYQCQKQSTTQSSKSFLPPIVK